MLSPRFGQHGQPVRMLDLRVARRETEDVAQQSSRDESAADQTSLGLDHHHQVRRIGQVALAPDRALEAFGGAELVHAGQVAEEHLGHAVKSCADSVADFR